MLLVLISAIVTASVAVGGVVATAVPAPGAALQV